MERFAKVIINSTSNAVDRFFTYKISDEQDFNPLGYRVKVPFGKGNRLSEGYVVGVLSEIDVDKNIDYKSIKEFCDEKPLLTEDTLKLIEIMREKYLCTFMECIRLFLPVGISKGTGFKKKSILLLGRPLEGKFDKEPYTTIMELVSKEKMDKNQLCRQYDLSISSVNTLIKHDFIVISEEIDWRVGSKKYQFYDKKQLNSMQEAAVKRILEGENSEYLIHGVTGSGKTEVYLNLVEKMINSGKESIVLVPEIALTPQMIERFKGRFGDSIAIFHSRLSQGQRFDQWMRVKMGRVNVAVGARSALFLPFHNLGLIIIDEEHENSYKSDSDPKYDAREVAHIMGKIQGVKVVLGSATPSIETYNKATNGEIALIEMNTRVDDRAMPSSIIVDMREELSNNNKSMFSRILYEEIDKCLNQGNQVILFLNRRGFSPFVSCRKCGYVFKCKNCDISLTYHNNGQMVCHYCGYTETAVNICPKCKSKYVKYFGVGTEKVEKEINRCFKNARVIRMDYDTTRKKESYETLYNIFKEKKADILIGTQMIAKGLDFENVTLVGILAADLSLNNPDYRAAERTFQLITQVSGRAGRGEKSGKVIIQTYSPDNYSIQCAFKNDYASFFSDEIKMRKVMEYPPFGRVLLINISSQDKNKCYEYVSILNQKIRKFAHNYDKINILGPSASTIFKLKNEYRWNIIIKGDFNQIFATNIKNIVYETLNMGKYKNIKISLDINPNSFI
ncbi:primosomal protein N' [Hathewaya proteolytica]|nr:primosomal protein N' [Hathewaya proteolytica]